MTNENPKPLIGKLRGFYYQPWIIVAMATMLQLSTNFVGQAFPILMVALQGEFAWTLTIITFAYFLRSMVSAVFSPVSGWLAERYGARRVLYFSTAVYVAGLALLGTMSHIWQFYLYYAVMLGISQALFRVNVPTTVAAWFKRRLGLAVGIQQSAGGMGSSVMAWAMAVILTRVEWQTAFFSLAAIGGTVILALLLRFHGAPEDKGLKPYGAAADDPPPSAPADPGVAQIRTKVFLRQARHTRAFWNLILIHYLGCVGHSVVMVGVVIFATTKGISLETAAFIISIYSLTSVISRFSIPIMADQFGAKGVMALAYAIQGITVAMLLWAHEPWQFFLFAGLFGIGMGGEMSAFLVINRQYYGMGPVRTIFGFQQMGSGIGMAIGGLLLGVIVDLTGSYDMVWIISIAASLGGAAAILFLEPTTKPLIPDWEDALPAEARSTPIPAVPAD